MALTGFPAVLRVTLGPAWTGRFGMSSGNSMDLEKVYDSGTLIQYSESGSSTFNKVSNRLLVDFRNNLSIPNTGSPNYAPTGGYGTAVIGVAAGIEGVFSPTNWRKNSFSTRYNWSVKQKQYTAFGFTITHYNFKDIFYKQSLSGSDPNNTISTQWTGIPGFSSGDSGYNFTKSSLQSGPFGGIPADIFTTMEAGPPPPPAEIANGVGTGTGHGEASAVAAHTSLGEGGGTGHGEASAVGAHVAAVEGGGTGHGEAVSLKGVVANAEGTGTGHGEATTGLGTLSKAEATGTGHGEATSIKGAVANAEGTGTGHGEATSVKQGIAAGEGVGTGHGEAVSLGAHTGNAEGGGTGHGEAVSLKGAVVGGEGTGTGHGEAVSLKGAVANVEGTGTGHGEAEASITADAKGTGTGHGEATSSGAHTSNGEGTGTGHGVAVSGGAVLGGSRSIGRDQAPFGAKSNFPFVKPSDDIKRILGDSYLSYEDPDCQYALPLRMAWMYGFGETVVPNFPGRPTPTHSRDLIIEDDNGIIVFDSTTATDFVVYPFGGRLETIEWKTADAVCRVTRHTKAEIGDPPLIFDSFIEPVASELDQITYRAVPRRVRAFRVGLVRVAAENVIWEEGFNVGMTPGEVVTQDGGRRVQPIVVTANPGDGLGRVPACEDSDPLVRKINNVEPDTAGNFKLDAAACYRVQRPTRVTNISPREVELYSAGLTSEEAAAALQIANDCGPCCECDDFINTYEGVRQLEERYFQLGQRAEATRDQYALNLDRWQSARDCYLSTPMRMVIRQDFGCVIGLGLNFCNLTDECLHDVEIRLTFEGFMDGADDPSIAALVPICPETVKNGTDTNYEDRAITLDGAYPALSMNFNLAEERTTQKLRAYLLLSGCANGQTLCITATAHYAGGDAPEIDTGLGDLWAGAGVSGDPARASLKKCVPLSPASRCP